jgi:hypothetical protein
MSIREDDAAITRDLARFVPHVIGGSGVLGFAPDRCRSGVCRNGKPAPIRSGKTRGGESRLFELVIAHFV